MCDPAQIPYKPNDVVWVKLGTVWWPAQVQDPDKLEKEVTEGLKKTPLVIVKFFNEDTYEYIRNLDQIYHYNCTKKNEFLQKGLDLCRPNNSRCKSSSMGKFPDDVRIAEEISGGNPDICNDPMFKYDVEDKKATASAVKQSPESKTPLTSIKRVRSEADLPPPKKRNRNSLPSLADNHPNFIGSSPEASSSKTDTPATVPRPRRKPPRDVDSPLSSSVIQDTSPVALRRIEPETIAKIKKKNYQANIRIQPSPPSLSNMQEYICYRCNDRTNRLSRLIEHYRAHDKHGMNVPPMSPMITSPLALSIPGPSTVDSLSTPKSRREKTPKTKSRKSNKETPTKKKPSKEETPKSDPIRKSDGDVSIKKKQKKTLKSKAVEADRNKVLRENILKDWDDESDDESANNGKVVRTTAEVHFPSSRKTEDPVSVEEVSDLSEQIVSDQNLTTENNVTPPSNLDVSNTEPSAVKLVDDENMKKKAEQSPEVPIAVENKGEEEKSCFDFEEDLDEAINLDKSHKFGQKLPRVINEEKMSKSVNSSTASDIHQIVKPEDDSKILESKVEELLENTKMIEVPKIPEINLLPKRRSSRIRGKRNVSFVKSDEEIEGTVPNEESSVPDATPRSSKDKKSGIKNTETSLTDGLQNTTSEIVKDERIPMLESKNNASEKIEEKEVLDKSREKIDNLLDMKNNEEPGLELADSSKKVIENNGANLKPSSIDTCEGEFTGSNLKDGNDSVDKGNLPEDEEKFHSNINLEDEYIEVVSPAESKEHFNKLTEEDGPNAEVSGQACQDKREKIADLDIKLTEEEKFTNEIKDNLTCLTRKEKNNVTESEGSKENLVDTPKKEEIIKKSEEEKQKLVEYTGKEKEEVESEENKDKLMDLSVKGEEVMICEQNKNTLMDLSVKEDVVESERNKEILMDFPEKEKKLIKSKEEKQKEFIRKEEEEMESENNREKLIELFDNEKKGLESENNEEKAMDLSVQEENFIESKEIKEILIEPEALDLSEEKVEVKPNIIKEQTSSDVVDKCSTIEEPQISMELAEECMVDKKMRGLLEVTDEKAESSLSFEKKDDKHSSNEEFLERRKTVIEKENGSEGKDDTSARTLNNNKIEMNSDSDLNTNDAISFKQDTNAKDSKTLTETKHEQNTNTCFSQDIPKVIESCVEFVDNEKINKNISEEEMDRSKDVSNEDENKVGKLQVSEDQLVLSDNKTRVDEEVASENIKIPTVESEQNILADEQTSLALNDPSTKQEKEMVVGEVQKESSEVKDELSKSLTDTDKSLKNDKPYPVIEIGNYSNEMSMQMSSDIHQWTAMEYYADLEAQVRNDFVDDEPGGSSTDLSKNKSNLTKESCTIDNNSQVEVSNTQCKPESVSLSNSSDLMDEDTRSKNIEDSSQVQVESKVEKNDSPTKTQTSDSNKSRVIYDFKLDFPEHTVNEIPPKLTKSKKRKWETKEPDDKFRENELVNKPLDQNVSEKNEDLSKEVQKSEIVAENTSQADNAENESKKMKLDISELMETEVSDEHNITSSEVHDEITISNEPEEMKEVIVQSEDISQPVICQEISTTPSNTTVPSGDVNKDAVSETISVISTSVPKKEESLSDTNMLNFTTISLNSETDKKGITPFDPSQLELDINSMPVVIEEDLIQDMNLPPVTSVASSSLSRSSHKQIRIQLRKAGENTSSLLQGAQNGKIIRIPGTSKEPTVTKKVQLPSTSKVQTVTTIHSPRAVATTGNQAVMLKVPLQGAGQTKYTVSKSQIRAASLAPAGTSGHPVKLQIIPQGPHQSAKLVMQPQQKPFAGKLASRVVIKNQSGALGMVANKQLPMAVKPGQKININQKRIISGKNIITKTGTIGVSKAGAVTTQKNAKSVVVTKPGISVQTSKTVLPTVQGTSVASTVQVVNQNVPSKVIMRRAKSSSGTISTVKSLPSQKSAIFIQTSQGLVPANKTVTKQIMQQMPQLAAGSSAPRPTQPVATNVKRVPVNKSRQANVNILKGNQKKVSRQQVALQAQLPQHTAGKQQVLSIPATSISPHELILNNVPLQFQNITAGQGDVKMLYLVDERGQYHQVDNSPLIAIDSGENKNVFIESNSSNEVDNFLLTFGDAGVNVSTTTTTPSQDILAKALANTQVLQSDSTDIGETLDGTTLYVEPQFPAQPTLAHNVLETSFSLNPPIMTPLEVPSSVSPQVTSIATSLITSSTVDTLVQKKADAQPSMPLLTDDVEVGGGQTVYLDSSGLVTATSQALTFQVINSDGSIVASSDEILQKRLMRDDITESKESTDIAETHQTTVGQGDKSVSSFTFTQPSTTDNETKFIVEEKR